MKTLNKEIGFRLEIMAQVYCKEFKIDKKIINEQGIQNYFKFYKKLPDEILAINSSIKEMKKFCINYKP